MVFLVGNWVRISFKDGSETIGKIICSLRHDKIEVYTIQICSSYTPNESALIPEYQMFYLKPAPYNYLNQPSTITDLLSP